MEVLKSVTFFILFMYSNSVYETKKEAMRLLVMKSWNPFTLVHITKSPRAVFRLPLQCPYPRVYNFIAWQAYVRPLFQGMAL